MSGHGGGAAASAPMLVARVIGVLEPGGAQLSALRLSTALREHGIQTRFLAGDATPAGLDLARAHGFEVESLASADGLQWEPSETFARWLAPRLADVDLVHAHMFGAWWAAAHAARPAVPLVASEHNALTWPGAAHDEEAREAAPRVARFFAHGPAAHAWALSIGVRPERLEQGESPMTGFDIAPLPGLPVPRITFTGRFRADKAPDVLIEALGVMSDPPPVYVLGDGELRPLVERRVAELGLERVVRFCGWVHDPGRWVAGASVHVVPSREEAWSQSAVQAMGLGVPVIGTAVEGLPATLAEGRGILVPPEDPPALAAAIADVLAGRRRPDLAAARAYARRFSPERIAERYAGVYRDLVSVRGPVATTGGPAAP